jgi:hypothetical protein
MKIIHQEHQLRRVEATPHKASDMGSAEMSVGSLYGKQEQPGMIQNKDLPPDVWPPLPRLDDVGCIGWNFPTIQVLDLPMYFPLTSIQYEFPRRDLYDILTRLSLKIRGSSIQASLCDNPLSAKLQTCENVELYLVFFQERPTRKRANIDDGEKVMHMSVQRHKGDQMVANQYIHGLVDTAKGVDDGESKPLFSRNQVPSLETVEAVERLIEQIVKPTLEEEAGAPVSAEVPPQLSHPFLNQTPEEMAKTAIQDIHGWLEYPKRLDLRRSIFDYLLAMTDLNRTLKSTAVAGSLLVLQGKAPAGTGMENEAKEIQLFVLRILQNRQLPSDRAMFEGFIAAEKQDNDIEMRPYFPEESDSPSDLEGLPHYFIEYANELFHLALQVLVQSLEVVALFHQELAAKGFNVQEMATGLFLDASEAADSKDLYTVLINCVGRAECKLSNGYLACKALRLLAMASLDLKESLKMDEKAKASISYAYQVGQTCHSLLKDESYQLWETVRH